MFSSKNLEIYFIIAPFFEGSSIKYFPYKNYLNGFVLGMLYKVEDHF